MLANVITDVGLGLFRDVDVVIGCLDNREARLWVNRCCWKVGTPWIDGGIQEINGVVKVFVPPDGACYECAMTENDYRLINLRYSCPLLRQEDLQAGKVPTAPTISSMIGGLQTQEALKLIHGLPVESGTRHDLQRRGQQVLLDAVSSRREDCMSHETYPDPLELPICAATQHGRGSLGASLPGMGCRSGNPARIELDRDLVVSIDCAPCGTSRPMMRPLQKVGNRDADVRRRVDRLPDRRSCTRSKRARSWPRRNSANWGFRLTTSFASCPRRQRARRFCWPATGSPRDHPKWAGPAQADSDSNGMDDDIHFGDVEENAAAAATAAGPEPTLCGRRLRIAGAG